jgi:hypothetical protein
MMTVEGYDPYVGEEYVGDDDYVGDDEVGADPLALLEVSGEDPFVGAAPRMAFRRQMTRRQAVRPTARSATRPSAQQQAQHLANLTRTEKMPAVPLPVDSLAQAAGGIAAGATLVINVVPLSRVRITNFTISRGIAPNFVINAIQAGRVNLLVGGGSIPADRYAGDSNRGPLEVPLVEAGTIIQVSVTNISGAASRFLGVFDCLDLTVKVG